MSESLDGVNVSATRQNAGSVVNAARLGEDHGRVRERHLRERFAGDRRRRASRGHAPGETDGTCRNGDGYENRKRVSHGRRCDQQNSTRV
jgi:hypothetical protein